MIEKTGHLGISGVRGKCGIILDAALLCDDPRRQVVFFWEFLLAPWRNGSAAGPIRGGSIGAQQAFQPTGLDSFWGHADAFICHSDRPVSGHPVSGQHNCRTIPRLCALCDVERIIVGHDGMGSG